MSRLNDVRAGEIFDCCKCADESCKCRCNKESWQKALEFCDLHLERFFSSKHCQNEVFKCLKNKENDAFMYKVHGWFSNVSDLQLMQLIDLANISEFTLLRECACYTIANRIHRNTFRPIFASSETIERGFTRVVIVPSPKEVCCVIINACIALSAFRLPVYVLWFILEWHPLVAFSNLSQFRLVKCIESCIASMNKISENEI